MPQYMYIIQVYAPIRLGLACQKTRALAISYILRSTSKNVLQTWSVWQENNRALLKYPLYKNFEKMF